MDSLLSVSNLSQHFPIYGGLMRKVVGKVYAVNDVNFELKKGQTLGVVGESGCGKSTLARTILRLYEPTSGKIVFKGQDITDMPLSKLKDIRSNIQMIFQDPYASLNPRLSVKDILEEPLKLHKRGNKEERKQRIAELLETVGLSADSMLRFPHEFSGGQRQRIGIARALALNPDIIIADEAVSALDVSIQSQILNLLNKLQQQFQLTYIFISHDLAVVKYIADHIMVMYLGKVVEYSDSQTLFKSPQHPYTKSLLASIPQPDPHKKGSLEILEGDVPSPRNPPSGCVFHTRCPLAKDVCRQSIPKLKPIAQHQMVACHLA